MDDLPELWSDYLRLQIALECSARVEASSWGLEAGLNRLLADQAVENVDRTVQSASRKERNRATLLTTYVRASDLLVDPIGEAALDARRALRLVHQAVSSDLWELLRAVGEGHEFEELAVTFGARSGTLRTRLCRFRLAFGDLRPAA
jgi:hypothetical protein